VAPRVAARVAVGALAAVAAAWFAIGVRQDRDTTRATAIVAAATPPTAAQARQASDLLQTAAFLNPDRDLDIVRARLELVRGNQREARAILKRVVSEESLNLEAWIWLARASVGDLRDFYTAAYRIQQLVPPVRAPH
jgi:predicted Zn-dependent protease